MKRSELILAIASDNPHLTPRDIETVIDTIFNQISIALAQGHRVELRGFGNFTVRQRKARMARNPRNGAAVPVGKKVVPFFKVGKELRQRVDRGPVVSVIAEKVIA